MTHTAPSPRLWASALLCVALLCACGHNHEHNHNHEHESVHSHAPGQACSHEQAEDIALSVAAARAAGVEVRSVEPTTFTPALRVGGHLDYPSTAWAVVAAPAAGFVRLEPGLADGTRLSVGAVVARIEADSMAGGDPVRHNEAAHRIARERLERVERLLAEQLATRSEYEAALEQYERTRIALEATPTTQGQRGYRVVAPCQAMVAQVMVADGQQVEAGAPLLRLVRGGRMVLSADVPLSHLGQMRQAKSAAFGLGGDELFFTDSLNARSLPQPTTAQGSGAYMAVRWEVDAPQGVPAGSFVQVYLHAQPVEQALCVPFSALMEEAGSHYVYVQTDSAHYRRQSVHIAGQDGQRALVDEGLAPGARVVTLGAAHVRQAAIGVADGGHGHSH